MKKYILSLFIFAFIFSLLNVNFTSATVAAPSCAIVSTLQVGSRGEQVKCLQIAVGVNADGKFGPKTKAAVMAWQSKWGLVPDGKFGAKSRANWVANGGISGNFPPGCQSASGNSTTTGLPCYAMPSQSPVISGVSGPQTLNVNQEGTWTVTAYDKNGGNLSYSVVWGDEVYAMPMAGLSQNLPVHQQSATFTHSYATAGKYTPKFTVTNDIVCIKYPCPNSASTSLSVKVGEISTITPTISSLSSTSGVIGSQVTIYGNNFTATGNRIRFGDSNSENDPSYNLNSNGNSVTFTVPSSYYVACLYTVPACKIATRMIQPGTYEVSVINEKGTSNAMTFTVTPTYYYQ